MDDPELLEREHRSQAAYYRLLANGHADSFVADLPGGVQATVVPVSPSRSLPNAVLYDDPAAVIAGHAELSDVYARAGVRAWTVWVRPGDDDLAYELEQRGHRLDGTPMIMGTALEGLGLEAQATLDLDEQPRWDVAGAINDAAYGLEPGALRGPLSALRSDQISLIIARLDGEPVACAGFLTTGGDCQAGFVATLPQARGRGLCAAIMREGLRRARADGATSATLEGSAKGEPVYQRLGYRDLGRARMMELRARTS